MQVLSIMPLSTAGINNRQMKSNTMSAVSNQNIGDRLSFQGRVFVTLEGKKLIKPEDVAKGMETIFAEMKTAGLSKKALDEAREFFTGEGPESLKALSKQHQVDTLVTLMEEKGKKLLNFEVVTDSKNRKLDYIWFQRVFKSKMSDSVELKEPDDKSLTFVQQCRNTFEKITYEHAQKYAGKSTN